MDYRIAVTEVTLYGKLRCVAGFDLNRGEMVRPEPEAGGFWPALVCGANTTFHPGHVVRFRGEKPDTAFPHRTEDVVAAGKPYGRAMDAAGFRRVLARCEALTSDAVYGAHLRFDGDKAFVAPGAVCGSLACQTIEASQLRLVQQASREGRRLRAEISLRGHVLRLAVTAKDFKQVFQKDGLDAARALAPRAGRVQLRLGLARPFDEIPDRCYLQINGLHAL